MNQHNIFNVPIWGYVFNQEQQHLEYYIDALYKLQSMNTSEKKSNFGGWQSQDNLQTYTVFKPLCDSILSICRPIINQYTNIPPVIQSLWGNINYKNNFNAHHTHEGWLSGVFYLQTPPNSGRLIFVNPMIRSERTLISCKNYPIVPQTLACIIFPSWLEHYVEPSASDTTRISMSFNIGDK